MPFAGIGELQDGALAANNPNWVMLTELSSLSMVGNRCLDFVASFGTGWFGVSSVETPRGMLGCLVPEWAVRVSRCVLQGLDAERQYRQSFRSLEEGEQAKHHRINPFLSNTPVSLDNVQALNQLEQLVRARFGTIITPLGHFEKARGACPNTWQQGKSTYSRAKQKLNLGQKWPPFNRQEVQGMSQSQHHQSPNKPIVQHTTFELLRDVEKLRLAMVATAFYALLLTPPRWDTRSRRYITRVGIASRWEEDVHITSSLQNLLRLSSFQVQEQHFLCQTPLECTLAVTDLFDRIDIRLQHSNQQSHSISGFPISIAQMMYLQGPHGFGLSTSIGKRKRYLEKRLTTIAMSGTHVKSKKWPKTKAFRH